MSKLKTLHESDGILGVLEKILFRLKKIFWSAYYRRRFRAFGRGSIVTGYISLRGAKKTIIGSNVVIEEGSSFFVSDGELVVGDSSFIGAQSQIVVEGHLTIGERLSLLKNSQISSLGNSRIGKEVWVARDCWIGGKDLSIEDHVIIGPGVFLIDADHRVDSSTGQISMHGEIHGPIRIESNAWIGARTVILKKVTIGSGAIVGAGSVVTKDVPPHVVAVGVPAKAIKKLG